MNVNAIDYICTKIVNSEEFNDCYVKLFLIISKNNFNDISINPITNDEYKKLLRYADFFSNSDKEYYRGLSLKIISSVYELFNYDYSCQLITKSILSKFGLFSAEEVFTSDSIELPVNSELSCEVRKLTQKISLSDNIFTNSQFEIYKDIIDCSHFSFSGPTSLGKSFILKNTAIELIDKVDNIVFILPTKALLEEYLIDFRYMLNERKLNDINISKSVSGVDIKKKNILIFTQERYNSFLFEPNYKDMYVDILIIDEAHKLVERKSKRTITLFKVIRRSLDIFDKMRVVFSSPVISNPEVFFTTFDLGEKTKSLSIKESPVAQNLYFADIKTNVFKYFDSLSKKVIEFQPQKTYSTDFELITSVGEKSPSNLVFISSKSECVKKCDEFLNYLIETGKVNEYEDKELLLESQLIADFIHEDFYLSKLIKYGVAYHHGSLPTFIRKRIEDLYARKKIKYIFCTSTLLEGVNLPTKNVFIYPFSKMTVKDESKCSLDFWNLAGRAGRYKNELTGNIICINSLDMDWTEVEEKVKKDNEVIINDWILEVLSKHRKILNYLNDKTKEPHARIKELSALILHEIMDYNKTNKVGTLLSSFPDKIKNNIISSGNEHLKRKGLEGIDQNAFVSNHNFDSNIQAKAFSYAKNRKNYLHSYNRDDVAKYIYMLNDIYGLRKNPDSLEQLIIMTYSWLRGTPLSMMINNAIKYGKKVRDPDIYNQWIDLDIENPIHINQKILETIECIENEITFKLESYSAHFYQLCSSIYGELDAGYNLAPFLEYGAIDLKEIELQDFGFSRAAANELIKKHKDCIQFSTKESNLKIKVNLLRSRITKHSLIERELNWLVK
ncbi:DEAD/DEAH box helicase [Aliivibrio sifiae]|uniref:DEAD/DEAH box helicase n=1 Tax=Aliivibrio sifiae TaxID=566293 RepID=A0A2S7XHD2_9GAMM|nr:DEAD/DEAH box helicase [Aliivibrio sifiae]PQJ93127.1 hypothetical protein BTO23_03260 [Aliivibrio sifiae]GLR75963.1 hypothetical protein GCM10007855_28370 [Aliivibrio sifiae]